MNKYLYQAAIDYELLTKTIYEEMLKAEGVSSDDVKHNTLIKGRSGVKHQVDVSWQFTQASVAHTVLVECKNYESVITMEKVRNFFAVLHDIGNCRGLMVTKTGYQSGIVEFAKFYGIGLKLLRKPTEDDWKGKVRFASRQTEKRFGGGGLVVLWGNCKRKSPRRMPGGFFVSLIDTLYYVMNYLIIFLRMIPAKPAIAAPISIIVPGSGTVAPPNVVQSFSES